MCRRKEAGAAVGKQPVRQSDLSFTSGSECVSRNLVATVLKIDRKATIVLNHVQTIRRTWRVTPSAFRNSVRPYIPVHFGSRNREYGFIFTYGIELLVCPLPR